MTTELTPAETAVQRLMAVFGEPRTTNPDMFLIEFVKAVKGYPDDVLIQACDHVIRKCTYWPKPAEMREAAERILASRQSESRADYIRRLDEQERDWKAPNEEERTRVRALFDRLKLQLKGIDGDFIDARAMGAQRPGFERMRLASPNRHLHQR